MNNDLWEKDWTEDKDTIWNSAVKKIKEINDMYSMDDHIVGANITRNVGAILDEKENTITILDEHEKVLVVGKNSDLLVLFRELFQ